MLEPSIWKLGEKTLRQLKSFALAAPFWSMIRDFAHPRDGYKSIPPYKALETFSINSGLQLYLNILRSIRPQIFFSLSITPFQIKELLPCWAQVRTIYVFEMLTVTNDLESNNDWELPSLSVSRWQNDSVYKIDLHVQKMYRCIFSQMKTIIQPI